MRQNHQISMPLILENLEAGPNPVERQDLLELMGSLVEDQNLKKCTKCKVLKKEADFYKCKSKRSGLRESCKDCHKLYHDKNREIIRIRKKISYHKNREKNRERDRKRYREDPQRRQRAIEYSKQWGLKNPRIKRDLILKRTYGISIEQYEALFEKQNGVCAVCEKKESIKRFGSECSLSVDHCHGTNQVRGLLCNNCNRAIGLLKDNIQVLNNMVNYLKKHELPLMSH